MNSAPALLSPCVQRALLCTVVLITGCATRQGEVVLLPEPGGRPTAVSVEQGDRQLLLDRPYAAAELTSAGPKGFAATAEQVKARYAGVLSALPAAPVQFTLYFVEGKDEFTEESKRQIDSVFGEIARRPVADVVVVGHTDKVGTDSINDPLSRQRAEVVRVALIARGIAADKVSAVGRGKREPLVPTADGVAEPRNRRVEILVR